MINRLGQHSKQKQAEARPQVDAKFIQWLSAEERLSSLAKIEDKLIRNGMELPECIDKETDTQVFIQNGIIAELLNTRSTSQTDSLTKLNLWMNTMGVSRSQEKSLLPAERLARQAIMELNQALQFSLPEKSAA